MAPNRGAGLSRSTRAPRGKAQPLANIVLALGDWVACVAVDNEAVLVGDQSNAKRAIRVRMTGAGTDHPITARNVASERAGSRTHIECVHVQLLREICWR